MAEGIPEAPRWSAPVWARVFAPPGVEGDRRWVVLAEEAGESIGFGVLGLAGDEAEIESVAVVGAWRGKGIGRALCERMVHRARAGGAGRVLLEVRASNEAAHCLYRALGFGEAGRRRGYYRDPEEDAVVMVRDLRVAVAS
ncbi:MAG TPA: ribosomal protein S18-alanine N-acetyltransferase [Acidobacteriaceae bacterium]|nr:ribosomal protein S18-alanine N-acetyltransferase [Acidobacteriaceae bacterium]